MQSVLYMQENRYFLRASDSWSQGSRFGIRLDRVSLRKTLHATCLVPAGGGGGGGGGGGCLFVSCVTMHEKKR